MLNASPRTDLKQTDMVCDSSLPIEPQLRSDPIKNIDDYGIEIPAWLKDCLKKHPPQLGQSCPTDADGLLAGAFHLAFQLHDGQFRASGEPYIIHPLAVADLLRDIGASPSVIAAGFLHEFNSEPI